MTNNRYIWDEFADIDPKFTKAITGRDYKGTSPNPQYVVMCLTELFGPVGKGFGWNVLAEDFTLLGDTQLHWCRIRFWWRDSDGVNECEQYGQTKAAYKTKEGHMRVDEDAPKKSLTDAIVKAASHLGIAANIFLGRWDDQKYVAEVNQEYRREEVEMAGPTPLDIAIATAGGARSIPDLGAIWSNHQQFHNEITFRDAVNKRKAKLNDPQANT